MAQVCKQRTTGNLLKVTYAAALFGGLYFGNRERAAKRKEIEGEREKETQDLRHQVDELKAKIEELNKQLHPELYPQLETKPKLLTETDATDIFGWLNSSDDQQSH